MRNISQGWGGVCLFLLLLQVVASLVRYGVRAFIVKRLGLDDLFSFVTLVFSVAYNSCTLFIFATAAGLTIYDIDPKYILPDIWVFVGMIFIFGMGIMFLKISICMFLLQIFNTQRKQRIIIYVVLAVNVSYGAFYFFFNLFQCGPNPADILTKGAEGKCFTIPVYMATAYSQAVICALSDIILAILPIQYLRTANMDRKTKLSAGILLGFAFIGCIVTIVRIGFLHYLTGVEANLFTKGNAAIGFLSMSEMCIGIVCLAVTTYKPLFKAGTFGRTSDSGVSSEKGPNAYVPQEDSLDRLRHRSRDLYDVESDFPDFPDFPAPPGMRPEGSSSKHVSLKSNMVLSEEDLLEGKYWYKVGKEPIVLQSMEVYSRDTSGSAER